jgi:hypothetical protein
MRSTLTLVLLALAVSAQAQPSNRKSVAVTVYNNNLGVVREVRTFDIHDGVSEVRMQEVPSQIDPTTVKIASLDHPKDIDVLEQNYEYDLVSQQKLLEKYIDKTITVTDDKGVKTEGTLLAVEADKLTLSTATGIVMLPNLARYTVSVPSLTGGLITKPTLIWKLQSTHALTNEPLEVLYQTGGMSWHTEYIAALSDDDKSLDLTGWVSIDNTSGASYENAKLKLVAGALHRAQPPVVPMYGGRGVMNEAAMDKAQFEERGLFEYHLYDLPRPVNIMNNEVKQISLLEALGVHATKVYTYSGGRNAAVSVSFENKEGEHLGIPLPAGTVRVMKRDKDGSFQFVGEDRIEHTPRDEKVTLKVGDAFDIIGEREVINQRSYGSNSNEETVKVTLKNHKDESVTIDVTENLGTNWEITSSSMPYDKKNAYTVIFHVPVKARGEASVTYTVLHRW